MKKLLSVLILICLLSPVYSFSQQSSIPADVKLINTDYGIRFKDKEDRNNLGKLKEYIDEKDAELKKANDQLNSYSRKLNQNGNRDNPDSVLSQLRVFENKPEVIKFIDSPMSYVKRTPLTGALAQLRTYPETMPIRDILTEHRNLMLSLQKIAANKKALEDNIVNLKSDLGRAIDEVQKIYLISDNINQTKLYISLTFACIIVILLILFFTFLISRSKVGSARDFFEGNGLQFIALFALIISIILFGVLGILEGKELAAILSGIAGFILGKGINSNGAKKEDPADKPDKPDKPKSAREAKKDQDDDK